MCVLLINFAAQKKLTQHLKQLYCNAGDSSSFPGLGRSAREGIGYPLQYTWTSLVAQLVKNPPTRGERPGRPGFDT